AGAGGHREQQLAASADDHGFCGHDAAALVIAQSRDEVRRRVEQPVAGRFEVEGEQGFERRSCVEAADLAGCGFFAPDIEMPDDFAICGVEERDFVTLRIPRSLARTLRRPCWPAPTRFADLPSPSSPQ